MTFPFLMINASYQHRMWLEDSIKGTEEHEIICVRCIIVKLSVPEPYIRNKVRMFRSPPMCVFAQAEGTR